MHQFLPISSSEITIQHRRPSLFMLLLLKEHLFYINWISFRFSYAISLKSHTVCICFSLFQFDVCRMPMHERATELLKFRCANSMFRLLHWKFEDGILFCWKKKERKKIIHGISSTWTMWQRSLHFSGISLPANNELCTNYYENCNAFICAPWILFEI